MPDDTRLKPSSCEAGPQELDWLQNGLKTTGFFSKLTPEQIKAVTFYFLLVEYPAGFVVCQEATPGDALYLIYRGEVDILKKGLDLPVATLTEPAFFGEMSLLFGQPRSATVKTTKPTLLFALSSSDFKMMIEKHPNMAEYIRAVAEERRQELEVLAES